MLAKHKEDNMKWILIPILAIALSGCITLSDVATGAGATAGAVVSSAAGLGVPATAAITVVGATAGAAALEEQARDVIEAEVVSSIDNPWQAFAVAWNNLLNHAFEIVIAIGVAVFAIPMIMTFVLGKAMPRRKEATTMKENELLKDALFKQRRD